MSSWILRVRRDNKEDFIKETGNKPHMSFMDEYIIVYYEDLNVKFNYSDINKFSLIKV